MGRKAVAVAEAALQAAAPTATSAEHAGPAVGTARAPDDLLTAARHACARAIVKDARGALAAHLPERMWREGAYQPLARRRRRDPAAAARLRQAARDDYRAVARELRARLPESLKADLPRVDVARCVLKGDARRAVVGAPHAAVAVRASLVCYHHAMLALGDLARYAAEDTADSGGAVEGGDAVPRQRALAVCYYEAAARVLPRNGLPHNRLALCAVAENRHFDAAYAFCHALAACPPVASARESLIAFFLQTKAADAAVAVAESLAAPLRSTTAVPEAVPQRPWLRPAGVAGPPWLFSGADDVTMAAVLAAAAEEQPAEVLAAARQGQGAAARSSTSVAALDITRARADDLQRLALGLAALLYTRVTSSRLTAVLLALEALLQHRLALNSVPMELVIKLATVILSSAHHALAIRTDAGPPETCAGAVQCAIVALRLVWLLAHAPLARPFEAFAGLPAFTLVLLWMTRFPTLARAAAASKPSLYDLPPHPFGSYADLMAAVVSACDPLCEAVSALHATVECGDQGGDALGLWRRPARDADSGSESQDSQGSSGSGSSATIGPSDDETRRAEQNLDDAHNTDGEDWQTAALTPHAEHVAATAASARRWLERHGPRTPLQEDHFLRGLAWLPRAGARLLGEGRRRKGLPADAHASRAVLWTWRALAVVSSPHGVAVGLAGQVQAQVEMDVTAAAPVGAELPLPVPLPVSVPAKAELLHDDGASQEQSTPTALDGDEEQQELSALRAQRNQLRAALASQRAAAAAVGSGDLAAGHAAASASADVTELEPVVIMPTVLVPDTNVLLNAEMWAVLCTLIQGTWRGEGEPPVDLAVAVPLMVLKELEGIRQGGDTREEGTQALAAKVLAVLQAETHGRLYALTGLGAYMHGGGVFSETGVRSAGMSNDDVIVQATATHAQERATRRDLVRQRLPAATPRGRAALAKKAGVTCHVQRVVLLSGDKNMLLKARSRSLPACKAELFVAWLAHAIEHNMAITAAAQA